MNEFEDKMSVISEKCEERLSELDKLSAQLAPEEDVPHPKKFKLIRIRGIDDEI